MLIPWIVKNGPPFRQITLGGIHPPNDSPDLRNNEYSAQISKGNCESLHLVIKEFLQMEISSTAPAPTLLGGGFCIRPFSQRQLDLSSTAYHMGYCLSHVIRFVLIQIGRRQNECYSQTH